MRSWIAGDQVAGTSPGGIHAIRRFQCRPRASTVSLSRSLSQGSQTERSVTEAINLVSMAEATLILGVTQVVTGVVIPVTVAAIPTIWKEIVKFLKAMKLTRPSPEEASNLAIIRTSMTKLEGRPNLSWLRLPGATSLLAMLRTQANSLQMMIEKHMLRIPRKNISNRINKIALILQSLDNNEGQELYQERKRNLYKDLLAVLRKDDFLMPKRVASEEESMVTPFPRIRYKFEYHMAHGADPYPRTLTISSSVIECIEHVLRWLRDFSVPGSKDVALLEVFTEILPQALIDHRDSSRLGPIEIKQFHANVCFLRSFSRSTTFKEIQGEAGLKLDDEEKIEVNLCDNDWTTWNTLQQLISKIDADLLNAGRPPTNALQQRFRDSRASSSAVAETRSPSSSEIVDPNSCIYCGIHLLGMRDPLRELHHNKCAEREEALLRHASWQGNDMHDNAGLDRSERRRD